MIEPGQANFGGHIKRIRPNGSRACRGEKTKKAVKKKSARAGRAGGKKKKRNVKKQKRKDSRDEEWTPNYCFL